MKRWAAPASSLGALALSAICLARTMYSFTRSSSRRTACCLGSSPTVHRYIQKSEFRLYSNVRSSRALSRGESPSVTSCWFLEKQRAQCLSEIDQRRVESLDLLFHFSWKLSARSDSYRFGGSHLL
uniref:Putative secreted protein n=1 Tax=Amblyomma tuberculatum TaxID=48802 RepID=A0A6M2E2M4_9ACAR